MQIQEQRDTTDYYIGNNVDVGPDVVIASGAVLDAAPGSHLIIEAGVCIGSGVVIQVYGGDLTLASGVSLGKEVLLVGTGCIGVRACIGAESTLMNPQVEKDAVVPARSLIGGHGQRLPSPSTPRRDDHSPETEPQNGRSSPPSTVDDGDDSGATAQANGTSPHQNPADDSHDLTASRMVYGREQVMQLVKTLFPHRDSLNGNHPDSS